jgi:hypothetical protein
METGQANYSAGRPEVGKRLPKSPEMRAKETRIVLAPQLGNGYGKTTCMVT